MMVEGHKKAPLTYRIVHAILGSIIKWYFPVKVYGLTNVPDGPAIFIAPHKAVADSYVIMAALKGKRSTKFVAKAEYFADGDLKQRAQRWLVSQAAIPVDRDDSESGRSVQQQMETELRSGGSVGLHPEGTRAPDQNVYKAKTGFVYAAWATGVPVVPVLLEGTEIANPPGSRVLRRHPIEVTFLEPIYLHEPRAVGILAGIAGREKLELLRKRTATHQARTIMELFAAKLHVHYINEDVRRRQQRLERY